MNEQIPILQVESLTATYRQGDAWQDAIRDISLKIAVGQSYGLVGESGSGKTTLALAIMGYLGQVGRIQHGRVLFDQRNILEMSDEALRQIWGAQISFVPQDSSSSLNPSMRVGEQIAETLHRHLGLSQAATKLRVLELLRLVRLPDPVRVARSFPHQISGGMQQRVLIAMAFCTTPRLLVLDEPTTNLDVTTQASILDLFRDLTQSSQSAVLYVTHNLGVVAQFCDRVAVLYAGDLVEDASLADLFDQPLHPYTRGLLDSIPVLGENKDQAPLRTIPGSIPALGMRPAGCVFAPRCPLAIEICQTRPLLYSLDKDRRTRCHRWEEIASGKLSVRFPTHDGSAKVEESVTAITWSQNKMPTGELLELKQVGVSFELGRNPGDWLSRAPVRRLRAVDAVSLSIPKAVTVGLVGESGSGKTTLARAVVGLIERTEGEIELFHVPLPARLSRRGIETLRHIQMVFQNPEEALNPAMSLGATLRRPLITLLNRSREEADREVERLLAMVNLPGNYAIRLPNQLSGGEKQRIAIARAFAANPDLLIADEPVSSLDVSVQASILNLLNGLQRDFGTALMLISHDLAVVSYLADVIGVIYLGRLMEIIRSEDLLKTPYHPYTETLLSAVPIADPNIEQAHIRLGGDIPSPVQRPAGCPFHTRCPRVLGEICTQQEPPWQEGGNGHRIYCHISFDQLRACQTPVLRFGKQRA
jgi:peptide/nickel transport system ATP-binding protein